MPEGDTLFRTARTLHRALAGQLVTGFDSVLPKLARVDVDSGITGRIVEKVRSQGKWLLLYLSGDLILLSHMLMSGSWHIYRPGETWQRRSIHMRIVLKTEAIWAVAFNVPIAEFHTPDTLRRREGFRTLGQDVLTAQFDPERSVAQLRANGDLEVGVALLTQSLIAGIGNIFKSETCFACGINPFRLVSTLTAEELNCLVATARKFLLANVTENSRDQITTYAGLRSTTGRASSDERLWVYGRRGQPCRRCATPIESYKQGLEARTTFWCPQCQPMQVAIATRSAAPR
ncbi:MAG TPA: DNA-formamidopyrimidine glycosylase family protein [Candidatus Acidoferrum sp.]|nr:DNA-formamidopyrimidine glycosylase family protein [Candidatus Acidoferrum sp.]